MHTIEFGTDCLQGSNLNIIECKFEFTGLAETTQLCSNLNIIECKFQIN